MRLPSLLILALVVFSSASTAEQSRLLIQRIGPATSKVYIANADGSGERQLPANSALDYNASPSPNGQWLVFTSEREGSADLYRCRIDGSSFERLTDDPAYDDQASWSPDGLRITFVSTRRTGRSSIWVMDLATRRVESIAADAGSDFRPSWSPDSQWIAFSSDRGTRIERDLPEWEHLHRTSIYVVHPDGSGLRRLTNGERFAGSPRWSPDGKRIVFYEMNVADTLKARDDEGRQSQVVSQIVSVDITSGTRVEHTSGGGFKVSPQYVSDGRIGYLVKAGAHPGVAYTSGERGPSGHIRNPSWSHDGRSVSYDRGRAGALLSYQPLQTFYSGNAAFELAHLGRLAAFSSNGDRLAFSEPVGGDWAITVMNADGSASQMIFLKKGAAALAPRWSPDGKQIVFGLGGGFVTRDLPARIMMMDSDGSNVRVLTTATGAGFPSLSPDGRRLVFRVWGSGADERGLRILTLESQTMSHLTRNDYDTLPGWSPRGDLIAFTSWRNGDFDIYTIRPDGTGLKQLTSTAGNDAHSSWSPDGEYLMFSSSRFGFRDEGPLADDQPQPYGEIFVMRADGTEQRPLTNNQWEDGSGAWQPARANR